MGLSNRVSRGSAHTIQYNTIEFATRFVLYMHGHPEPPSVLTSIQSTALIFLKFKNNLRSKTFIKNKHNPVAIELEHK